MDSSLSIPKNHVNLFHFLFFLHLGFIFNAGAATFKFMHITMDLKFLLLVPSQGETAPQHLLRNANRLSLLTPNDKSFSLPGKKKRSVPNLPLVDGVNEFGWTRAVVVVAGAEREFKTAEITGRLNAENAVDSMALYWAFFKFVFI